MHLQSPAFSALGGHGVVLLVQGSNLMGSGSYVVVAGVLFEMKTRLSLGLSCFL